MHKTENAEIIYMHTYTHAQPCTHTYMNTQTGSNLVKTFHAWGGACIVHNMYNYLYIV